MYWLLWLLRIYFSGQLWLICSWQRWEALLASAMHKGDRWAYLKWSWFSEPGAERLVSLLGTRAVELSVTFPVVLWLHLLGGLKLSLLWSWDRYVWGHRRRRWSLSGCRPHLSYPLKPIQTGCVIITERRNGSDQSDWSFTPVTKMKDGIFIAGE